MKFAKSISASGYGRFLFPLAAIFAGLALNPVFSLAQRAEAAPQLQRLNVTTDAFKNGDRVPVKYTRDGEDVAPSLKWSAVPAHTKSVAVCCFDPDAPGGTWWHWIIVNLPPSTTSLAEGTPRSVSLGNGAVQGFSDFDRTGYGGPNPPPGKLHHYFFRVYALDTVIAPGERLDKNSFQSKLANHILAAGEVVGTYSRP